MTGDNIVKCLSCGGKGHVLYGPALAASLLVPVIGWVIAFGDRNNRDGITRRKCRQCKGTGFIRPQAKN